MMANCDENPSTGCWEWNLRLDKKGYGRTKLQGHRDQLFQAHRVMYELLIGPIPDGLQLDHLCRVRHCVNPIHLEPVTSAENSRRGEWWGKPRCAQGHEFTPENTYWTSRHTRFCRECKRIYERRYYLEVIKPRRKAKASTTTASPLRYELLSETDRTCPR
jgi:hypothetical protein